METKNTIELMRERLLEIGMTKGICQEYEELAQNIRLTKAVKHPTPEGYTHLETITTKDEVFRVYQKGIEILVLDFTTIQIIPYETSITEYCEWFEDMKAEEQDFKCETVKLMECILKNNEKQTFGKVTVKAHNYTLLKKTSGETGLTLNIFTEARYKKLIVREFKEVK